ncbi:hypothetical protein ACLKA7_013897 [Drosophila subpalustris]
MSIKQPLKFGRAMRRNGLLAKRYTLCRLGMLGMNSARGRRNNVTSFVSAQDQTPIRWNLQVDVERSKEKKDSQLSLPWLLYLYSPWQMAMATFNLWKLKIFWDWHFSETQFLDNSKQALVVITKLIREQRGEHIQGCTTPMGYKQIMHDLVMDHKTKDYPLKLLRFEKRHVRRAYLLKVQQLPHYDHKFAFVDVFFCACRRTNDFNSESEISEMNQLIDRFVVARKLLVPYPIVLAEFFVRFRRDYSIPATIRTGHWLISTYKILKLDILNYHPEFYVGSQHESENFHRTVRN